MILLPIIKDMSLPKKILKDCFTGSDNETYSLLKIIFVLVQIVYLCCSILDCNFNMIEFGTGEGALIAAFGSALWLSKDFQPKKKKINNV